eukprot:scaffold496916_cov24-Prasinocladus_malaysianus.AAC.1
MVDLGTLKTTVVATSADKRKKKLQFRLVTLCRASSPRNNGPLMNQSAEKQYHLSGSAHLNWTSFISVSGTN